MVDLSFIQGRYLQDILHQPLALADTLARLEKTKALDRLVTRLQRKKYRRIVLTGMGASLHALHPIAVKLVECGFTAIMTETSELVHYYRRLADSHALILAVSQSGESAEVVRLLETNRGQSDLIAVTNNPDSVLAKRADALVQTFAGEEFSVSCKTYVASLMGLKWLGDILCGKDLKRSRRQLKQAATAASTYLSVWEDHVRSLIPALEKARQLFLIGRGASLAAVSAGSLILKESVGMAAEGMSSAAFRHGPFEMLKPGIFVVVFAGDAKTLKLNQKLLFDIRDQNAQAEMVGQASPLEAFRLPAAPADARALVEILPVQMITLALAALGGREPGRFRLVTKITTTE